MSEYSKSESSAKAILDLERELTRRAIRFQFLIRLASLAVLSVTGIVIALIVAGAGDRLAGRRTDITVGISASFALASVLSMVSALLSVIKARSRREEIRRLRQRILLLERQLGGEEPAENVAGVEAESIPADGGGYPPSGQPPVVNVFPPEGGNGGLGRGQLVAVVVAVVAGIFSIGTAWVGREADNSDCLAYGKQLAALDAQYPATLPAALDVLHFEGYEERCGGAKAIVEKLGAGRPLSTSTTAAPATTSTSSP